MLANPSEYQALILPLTAFKSALGDVILITFKDHNSSSIAGIMTAVLYCSTSISQAYSILS